MATIRLRGMDALAAALVHQRRLRCDADDFGPAEVSLDPLEPDILDRAGSLFLDVTDPVRIVHLDPLRVPNATPFRWPGRRLAFAYVLDSPGGMLRWVKFMDLPGKPSAYSFTTTGRIDATSERMGIGEIADEAWSVAVIENRPPWPQNFEELPDSDLRP